MRVMFDTMTMRQEGSFSAFGGQSEERTRWSPAPAPSNCVFRARTGLFSTELFERYRRSEKALVSGLAEMYVQGISTPKVKAVTETFCGHNFLGLGDRHDEPDAGCGDGGVCQPPFGGSLSVSDPGRTPSNGCARAACLPARRCWLRRRGWRDGEMARWRRPAQILGVGLARVTTLSWREFLLRLTQRGPQGGDFVVSDDRPV